MAALEGGDPFTLRAADRPPPLMVNWIVRNFDPTPRLRRRLPMAVSLAPVHMRPQRLEVGE